MMNLNESDMERERRQVEARRIRDQAYHAQMNGNLELAIQLYQRSISLWPTAEAHTYLGWTYSFKGQLDEAIQECRLAIEVDPDLGNPYNDIGAYLMQLNQFEEAIHWLEQACHAPRYDGRHYAWFNLGRIRERFGEYVDALRAYDIAGELEPAYAPTLQAAERLRAWMN